MKKTVFFSAYLLISMLLASCKVGPQPIAYGSDTCHYCSMTIVDRQHAAQLVTSKGKVFKFDASECLLNHLKEIDITEIGLFLVNDHNSPGELIDATKATYLISENIPSPMGAFLTAFEIKEDAEEAQNEHSGELLTWKQLRGRYKN